MRRAAKPIATEAQEQAVVVRWAALKVQQWPELALLHHIPNGGSRHAAEAANLKRQGVKPGMPDLFLPVPRSGYHGLYIEMKRSNQRNLKRGGLSADQQRMIKALARQGYLIAICFTATETVEMISHYMYKRFIWQGGISIVSGQAPFNVVDFHPIPVKWLVA